LTDRSPCVRVDAHHHVWDLAVRDQPWTADLPALRRSFTFAELRPQLAEARVTKTVLIQTVTVPEETPELLALAAQTPEIGGVVGWVDLSAADVGDRLAALRAGADGRWLVGIRHQVQAEPDPGWLLRTDVVRGLRTLANAGLGYDLLVTPPQLQTAIDVARQLPEVRFILDHGGKPAVASGDLKSWRPHITALAQLPNVAVKLSGLLTEGGPDSTPEVIRPYAEALLAAFGAQRVMFGSDWPVCTLRADYVDVVAITSDLLAGCSVSERAAVFAESATSWYRLEGTG